MIVCLPRKDVNEAELWNTPPLMLTYVAVILHAGHATVRDTPLDLGPVFQFVKCTRYVYSAGFVVFVLPLPSRKISQAIAAMSYCGY